MARIFFVCLFLGALVLGCLGFSKLEAQENSSLQAGVGTNTEYGKNLEQETFSLINQYRTANKLPALKWSEAIAVVARGHSKDMATGEVDFGHEGFGKRVSTLKTELMGLKGAGENVLKTDDPNGVAQAAVRLWLNSPHHLENIRGDFNYSGLGVWRDDSGMIYFTQFFVKVVPPKAQAAETTPQPAMVSPYVYLANPNTR
jgi:uncharacterized protein YkwD